MKKHRLNVLTINEPCAADWSAMSGDDAQRHCAACAKNVVNLDAMPTPAARQLLARRPGGLCVRSFAAAGLVGVAAVAAGCEEPVADAAVPDEPARIEVDDGPMTIMGEIAEPRPVVMGRVAMPRGLPIGDAHDHEPIDPAALANLLAYDEAAVALAASLDAEVIDYHGHAYPAGGEVTFGTYLRLRDAAGEFAAWLLPTDYDATVLDWREVDAQDGYRAYIARD